MYVAIHLIKYRAILIIVNNFDHMYGFFSCLTYNQVTLFGTLRTYSNLRSSSTIVIISKQSLCTLTPMGKEDESIVRVKISFCSNISSSYIERLNTTLVSPAKIVALKGPGS